MEVWGTMTKRRPWKYEDKHALINKIMEKSLAIDTRRNMKRIQQSSTAGGIYSTHLVWKVSDREQGTQF